MNKTIFCLMIILFAIVLWGGFTSYKLNELIDSLESEIETMKLLYAYSVEMEER
jgi:CHASE3 domain sensor protein